MPSITDNPEQFFNELSTPKEKDPSPVLVPKTLAPEENKDKTTKETSITDNPSAFFDQLSKEPEPYKQETPQSVFLGKISGKKVPELETFDIQSLNSLQPDELQDVAMSRKDLPLTDEQLRKVYEHHKTKAVNDQNYGTPSSLREYMDTAGRWAEPIGKVANDVAHTLWSAAKGAGKLAYRTADYVTTPDMRNPEVRKYYSPEQQAEFRKQHHIKGVAAEEAWQSAMEPIIGLPEELSWMGTKIGAGGMDWHDRASEALGLQSHEKSFENFKARRSVEAAQAQYYMEHPSSIGRMMNLPIVKGGMEAIIKNDMPTAEDWMSTHPNLSREQAKEQLSAIARDHVENSIKESEAKITQTDPDIATASTFLAPEGIGMGTMGALGMGARVVGETAPMVSRGLKYIGKTDAEINSMNAAAQNLNRAAGEAALKEASQPSLLEKAAGGTSNAIDWAASLGKGITEKIPAGVRPFVPYIAGGAAGGLYGHEQGRSVIGDVLHGIGVAGLLKAPALARDIEQARRISAGGTKGTFETLAGFPNVSEGAAKIIRFGGRNVDNLLRNSAEYAKSGIHATALAVATGALESADPEEMNNLISQGLIYGLGGHAFSRIKGTITGRDPILEKRKQAQQDVDNLKTFSELSPESQKTLNDVVSWDNVVSSQQNKADKARLAYLDAVGKGSKDAPELQKEWQAQTKALSSVMRANVQTRNEYGRLFVDQLSHNTNLVNGTLRAGQNNVGVHILTPDQIFNKFRQDPANSTKSDEEIKDAASQAGFYSTPDGAIEYKSGMGMEPPKKDLVFDRSKPSIVINADHIKARMGIFGESANQALNHEFGHHVANIPEFREANKDAEALLFSQEVKDPSGKVVATTSGRYSPSDLVGMYENNYMKGKTPEQIEQLSKLSGLWDYSRGAVDEGAVAGYMREEILAELNSETLSSHLGKDLDSGTLHLMDLARIKTKKNLLDKAINKFAGLGGKGNAVSPLTGAEYPPEVLAANRQAIRALQSLQGEVSPAVAAPDSPKISRAEMMKNKALMERYGKYSGLFKTKVQAQIFDGNGNPVGAPIDIANPNASEGSWQNKNGDIRQLKGYGQRPDEVIGEQIPEGGSLVVGRQVVTQADGKTPVMLDGKEARDLQKARVNTIRDALNTPDAGAPNRFEPTDDVEGTWRGTFTPLQIEAIKNLPEGIIPRSIKEHMLKINDMIVRGDGSRMLADYAAVMNDNGRYTPYSAKIYDVVPIGMHLSKAGHFLVTTVSVGRMFDKLNKWSERMPARLSPWNGSKDAFFKEFTEKYLQNWQNGVAGETGLAGTQAEALAKKYIFNDFLNLTTKDTASLNPDRTKTPRARGDVRGKDVDRTIMSMRLDHMAELIDNDGAPKVPVSYQKAKFNMMPKPEDGEDAVLKPLTFAPKGEQPAITPDILRGISAVHVPVSQPQETKFVFTTSTKRDDAIKKMIATGDDQGIRDLNRTTILHALSDLKHIPVTIEDTKGVYQGDKEVSSIIKVTTDNQQDLNRVRSRIADAAKMFQQMEFIEEKMGAGKRNLLGETDEDGFKHIGSSTLYVKGVTENQIESARKQAGIDGLTLADGRIELYDRGDDPEFFNRLAALDTALRQAGGVVTQTETGVASVKSYSEDPQRYAGTIGYDDQSLHIHSASGEQERLKTPLIQKLMGLMGRPMEAPKAGKKSYFEAKDVTPEQVKKQAGIAQRFTDLPLNDLKNPLVQKAYEHLNTEIAKQFDYLTEGEEGTKFTSQPWSDGGEPYASSADAINDIRTKNSLKFLKTDPSSFGPEGEDFSYHPLLQDSGRVDANGVKLTYNDLFRAVHDAIAHGLFGAEFGPVGEESAWQTHMRTLDDPWARWALTTETRGQNSYINYRDQMLGEDGMPLKKGDEGYIPLKERGFAEQKASLLPLEDSLTGDKKVDEVTRKLMKELGEDQSQGSAGGIYFMPKMAVVPERYTGTGKEEGRRGKYVEPPKFMGAFNISQYEKGGKFFDAETGDDLTDKTYENASISVDGGKPSLVANNESESAGTGPIIRSNLFKQKAGWKWISENPPETSTIVSVEGQGKHVYTMRADFQNGVKMARYPDKTSEPRLRPTGRGELVMGQEIGRIDIRGKEHPVYDTITIGEKPASDISFMPASKLDETYAKAIESGDMEEAQRLVDERAKQAGYDIGPVYHHGHFDPSYDAVPKTEQGMHFGTENAARQRAYQKGPDDEYASLKTYQENGKWYWKTENEQTDNDDGFSSEDSAAADAFDLIYGRAENDDSSIDDLGNMTKAYLSLKNLKKVKDQGNDWYDATQKAKQEGYDGFEYKNEFEDKGSTSYVIFNSEQASSADPATYDNEGKLIPLSQRFDTSKQDIRFMPKSEEPDISDEGHVFPKDLFKPFEFTPRIAMNFMPASEKVNWEDYLHLPTIALAADRMGIGQAYVGPTGAKQPLSVKSEGGAGFSTLYRDEEHNPIWAFSTLQAAKNFLKRINDVANQFKTNSVLVSPTLLAPDNHLKNQTGQLGYVEALEAALKAKMVKESDLTKQVNEIIKRIAESKSAKAKEATKALSGITTFKQFAQAVREKSFNFGAAEWIMKKAAQKKLPITAKELDQMGILPSQIAKDLAHEGYYELPTYSMVSLFEVPKDQQPEKGNFHNSYPYVVRGKSIGYLKHIINLAQATKEPKIFTKRGDITAQPLMTVMPILDSEMIRKALSTLQAYDPKTNK